MSHLSEVGPERQATESPGERLSRNSHEVALKNCADTCHVNVHVNVESFQNTGACDKLSFLGPTGMHTGLWWSEPGGSPTISLHGNENATQAWM